jgi:hypothetical protein
MSHLPRNVVTPATAVDAAVAAGFRDAELIRIVAIAMAESGLNANAHNARGEDSRGLTQVNVNAWPQFRNQNLYDPVVNMRAAMVVKTRQGWGAWSVWKNARALLFIPQATGAVGGRGTRAGIAAGAGAAQAVTGAVGGVASDLSALSDAANRVTQWVTTPANVGRLVVVLVGGIVIIVGVAVLLRPAAEQAVKTVGALK